tara:strand:- start:64 stop:414 length:351 start_codon:yes stop_codon:yes gene_type:complete
MAKFLKFALTGAQEEVLIPVSEIANVETVSTTVTKIDLANGLKKYTITHLIPLVPNAIVMSIYDAIKANPGGVVSTVGIPILSAQDPEAQSGAQGRIVIADPAAYATFTTSLYENV